MFALFCKKGSFVFFFVTQYDSLRKVFLTASKQWPSPLDYVLHPNPFINLRNRYHLWHNTHPCPKRINKRFPTLHLYTTQIPFLTCTINRHQIVINTTNQHHIRHDKHTNNNLIQNKICNLTIADIESGISNAYLFLYDVTNCG